MLRNRKKSLPERQALHPDEACKGCSYHHCSLLLERIQNRRGNREVAWQERMVGSCARIRLHCCRWGTRCRSFIAGAKVYALRLLCITFRTAWLLPFKPISKAPPTYDSDCALEHDQREIEKSERECTTFTYCTTASISQCAIEIVVQQITIVKWHHPTVCAPPASSPSNVLHKIAFLPSPQQKRSKWLFSASS